LRYKSQEINDEDKNGTKETKPQEQEQVGGVANHQNLSKGLAKETTKRTDERGAGGRWAGSHRLTTTDDED
jgi:hypothetical protein